MPSEPAQGQRPHRRPGQFQPGSSTRQSTGTTRPISHSGNGTTVEHGESVNSASGSAGAIIRDAKGLSIELKAMLKRKDPWDRELEFQREALRKVYLRYIFFTSPPSNMSNSNRSNPRTDEPSQKTMTTVSASQSSRLLDVLTLMWLETSHAIIHSYRSKISSMEKAIAENPKAHKLGPSHGNGNGNAGNGGRNTSSVPGPTARRKLLQSFRTFLAQEEEFWRSLLSRLANSLAPSDWAGLRSLGITIEDREFGETRNASLHEATSEADSDSLRRPTDVDRIQQSGTAFDPEAVRRLSVEERRAMRNATVPLAHKALIYFGDLARYRELYNEPSNCGSFLAATGKKETKKGSGKGGVGPGGKANKADGERKAKNWAKAAECYHQARLLLPDNGNPSNQLAVLSQYASDTLSSAYHYYRALSVRSPFATARKNLEVTYSKSVTRWFAEESTLTKDEGDLFRQAFVTLNGLYFVKARCEEIPSLSAQVERLFLVSVSQRLLPSEIIVKTAVTALCALWNARMFRTGGNSHNQPTSAPDMEPHLLLHVLSLYRILLVTGAAETNELVASNATTGDDAAGNLALNISAVLRRTLPAIRILSKWIMGQMEYIARVKARASIQEKKCSLLKAKDQSADGVADAVAACNAAVGREQLENALLSFWAAYVDFANAIRNSFPLDQLPSALDGGVWLEEDVDMLGFAPLRRGMKEGVAAADGKPLEIARVGKDVHPNEEQLMRIADIQSDAVLITDAKASPISFTNGRLIVVSSEEEEETPESIEATEAAAAAQTISRAFQMHPSALLQARVEGLSLDEAFEDDEEDGQYYPDETEDDPVDLAMRISEVHRMDMDIYGDDHEDRLFEDKITFAGGSSHFAPLNASSAIANNLTLPVHTVSGVHHPGLEAGRHSPGVTPATPRSIWGPPLSGSPAIPSAAEVFESIPNTTHQHSTLNSSNVWGPPRPSNAPTPSTNAGVSQPGIASLFGNFSPFQASGSAASSAFPTASAVTTFVQPQQGSNLSPHANPFNRSPQRLPRQLQGQVASVPAVSTYPYGENFG